MKVIKKPAADFEIRLKDVLPGACIKLKDPTAAEPLLLICDPNVGEGFRKCVDLESGMCGIFSENEKVERIYSAEVIIEK